MRGLFFIILFFSVASCSNKTSSEKLPVRWNSTNAIQELGYHLYFETKFSGDSSISCNTCHNILNQGNGAQSTAVSAGINGSKGGRNSPTVWNAKFLSVQFWDGRAKDLAEQAKGPITNPIEMGMESHDLAMNNIRGIENYKKLFKEAFPDIESPINIENAAKAIAAFEETLITLDSPYDNKSLTKAASSGYEEFKTVGCASCHSGGHFAGPELPIGTGFFMKFPTFPSSDLEQKYGFSKDQGRFEVTKNPSDKNMWRVPTLRNVAITAPYFHNGSVPDLKTAIRIMAKTQLNKDLTKEQVSSIEVFLNALTGERPLIYEPGKVRL